jgi:hypothetical protein
MKKRTRANLRMKKRHCSYYWHGNVNHYLEEIRNGRMMIRDDPYVAITASIRGVLGWEVHRKGEIEVALALRVQELERENCFLRSRLPEASRDNFRRKSFRSRKFP